MKKTSSNRFYAAEDISYDLDCKKTQRNRNTLVVGASGRGKTRSVVIPNLLSCNESYVVSDPKGTLYMKYHKVLEKNGYTTRLIDFINPEKSEGYNFFVDMDKDEDFIQVADIITRTHNNSGTTDAAFWDNTMNLAVSGCMGIISEWSRYTWNNRPYDDFNHDICSKLTERVLAEYGNRYPQTILGMVNLLDDVRETYAWDREMKADCVSFYLENAYEKLGEFTDRTFGNISDKSGDVYRRALDIRQYIHSLTDEKVSKYNLTYRSAVREMNKIIDRVDEIAFEYNARDLYSRIHRLSDEMARQLLLMYRSVSSYNLCNYYDVVSSCLPDCFGKHQMNRITGMSADKTVSNIIMTALAPLSRYSSDGINAMMEKGLSRPFSYEEPGNRKCAVFVCVSDTDRKMDGFANIFFSLFLQKLCNYRDTKCKGFSLPVPVRFILDDFASYRINNFEKYIANFRSRNRSFLLMIQAESQLEALYGHDRQTIIGCCDTIIFMGNSDITDARTYSIRTNRAIEDILYMPVGTNWIFVRGEKPVNGKNINLDRFIEELEA